jgi:hypothetical protein
MSGSKTDKLHSGILFILKKGNAVICNSFDEPRGHYVKRNKQGIGR